MALVVETPADLLQHVGEDLGASRWHEVVQPEVDAFARATHDEQWIHVDAERAAAGPFGTTIVHGYMTLSLVVPLSHDLLRVERSSMVLNYGLDRVRFPAPLPVGSRLRLTGTLAGATEVAGGVQVVLSLLGEREGGERPVLAADVVFRHLA
ncbi:MaoC family dehydratase [Pseudokineococcus marinus]|uniref:MaoC family dehydratase n=1 Tax=Pseudokineococcus marinus TaxID=351215 RepID=A0A849BTK2_9ACTN|nr:MaoC family dehydratase [Pseudokineococcus marinus]NNH23774.1 MaoC family dehydratase [Pseudokineococcus marinus]